MSQSDLESSMRKSVVHPAHFNTIRTGRANSSLLDRISVEYYGAETPLKSLATLSTLILRRFRFSRLTSVLWP